MFPITNQENKQIHIFVLILDVITEGGPKNMTGTGEGQHCEILPNNRVINLQTRQIVDT